LSTYSDSHLITEIGAAPYFTPYRCETVQRGSLVNAFHGVPCAGPSKESLKGEGWLLSHRQLLCRIKKGSPTAQEPESYTSKWYLQNRLDEEKGDWANESLRYYQPVSEINQDTCFPEPSPLKTPSTTLKENTNPNDANVNSSITSSKISSPDTALTAFCQLVTWRVGAQRAMIR